MSGFFQSGPASHRSDAGSYNGSFRNNEPAATNFADNRRSFDTAANNESDDNDLIERLAAAIMVQNQDSHHPKMTQQNDMERLRIMLASLTNNNHNNVQSTISSHGLNSKSMTQPPLVSPLAQRQKTWYTHERAILRELIVLIMRHSN